MAPKTPSKTTQTTEVKLPEWVDAASQANYAEAAKIGSAPFDPYQGPRVADLGDATKQGIGIATSTAGQAASGYNKAAGIFDQIAQGANALQPSAVTSQTIRPTNTTAGTTTAGSTSAQQVAADAVKAGQLKDTDLNPYMNPYLNSVVDTSLNDLDRSRQQSIMSNASNAVSSGAFGGSRQALTDAVTNSESALKSGQLSAQLRADAYDKAVAGATGDINRTYDADTGNANRNLTAAASNADRSLQSDTNNVNRTLQSDMSNRDAALSSSTANANRDLTAQQSNQQADMTAQQATIQNLLNTFTAKTGAQNTAASGIMSAAEGGQQANLKDFAALLQGGQLQQGQNQAQIDNSMAMHDEARNYDIDNLNLKLSALGMSPYGKSDTTTKTSTAGSSGTDVGQLGMGVFSLLLGLSEDDTKTDKEKVGNLPGTDLDLWAYRYKKDPKHYPKVVGVMASDVEKKMPSAVHRVNGKRVIDYGLIGKAMSNG